MATTRKSATADAPVIRDKYYEILVDAILGSTEHVNESSPFQYAKLEGTVSSADLRAAGVDIDWQLKIGALREVGYVPV